MLDGFFVTIKLAFCALTAIHIPGGLQNEPE